MFKRHLFWLCAAIAGATGLTGCTAVTDAMTGAWDGAASLVPYFMKPYSADVHQGNLVTSEMALQLERGMTDAQVQFLLGVPLVQDQFHEGRWDYVYYLRRGDGEEQIRRLSVYFDEDRRVDHWTSDPMPDEQQADQLILGTIRSFEPRPPKTSVPAAQPGTPRNEQEAEDEAGTRETEGADNAAH